MRESRKAANWSSVCHGSAWKYADTNGEARNRSVGVCSGGENQPGTQLDSQGLSAAVDWSATSDDIGRSRF